MPSLPLFHTVLPPFNQTCPLFRSVELFPHSTGKYIPCFPNLALAVVFFKSHSLSPRRRKKPQTSLFSFFAVQGRRLAREFRQQVSSQKTRVLFVFLLKVTAELVTRQEQSCSPSPTYSESGTRLPPSFPLRCLPPPPVRRSAPRRLRELPAACSQRLSPGRDARGHGSLRYAALDSGKKGSVVNYEWVTNGRFAHDATHMYTLKPNQYEPGQKDS